MKHYSGKRAVELIAWAAFLGLCYLPLLFLFVNPWTEGMPVSPSSSLSRLSSLARNSCLVSCGSTLTALAVGVPFGLLVSRTDLRLKRFFAAIGLLPLFLPSYATGAGWIYALGAQGFLNTSAQTLADPIRVPLHIRGLILSSLVLGLCYFPLVGLAAASASRSVSGDLEDTAKLYGGAWGVASKAVAPVLVPAVGVSTVVVFLLSSADFGVPALFGINVLSVEIYEQFAAYYNAKNALQSTLPLLVFCLIGVVLTGGYWRHTSEGVLDSEWRSGKPYKLSWMQPFALVFVLVVLFTAIIIPVAALVREAGSWSIIKEAWTSSTDQLRISIFSALVAASLIAAISVPLGYFAVRSSKGRSSVLRALGYYSLVVPGGITGLGLVMMWNRPGAAGMVYGSGLMIILAYAARFLPVAFLFVAAGIAGVSERLEEPGHLDGAGWFRNLHFSVIPYIRGWIAAAWVAVFSFSVGELATAVLVSPPGKETLPVRIFSLMHYGASSTMAALCLIIAFFAAVPAVVLILMSMVNPDDSLDTKRKLL